MVAMLEEVRRTIANDGSRKALIPTNGATLNSLPERDSGNATRRARWGHPLIKRGTAEKS